MSGTADQSPHSGAPRNRRILIVDDNASIHEDFKKILGVQTNAGVQQLAAAEAALFGDAEGATV